MPSASSDKFQVEYAKLWPFEREPFDYLASGNGGAPGAPGGPLLFNFASGWIGADVYLEGFLERTQLPRKTNNLEQVPEMIQELPELAEASSGQAQIGLRSLFEDISEAEE